MVLLRISSFNCKSIKSSVIDLAKICNECDIVLLQETWLRSCELNVINSVHNDFEGRAWSAMDDNVEHRGRPFGGLAVMWRKSLKLKLSFKCKLINERIVVLDICNGKRSLCIINVYMPVAGKSVEQKEDYLNMLGLVACALSNICVDNNVMVMGDFNASTANGYLSFVSDFCSDEGFDIVDMQRLCTDSYTFEAFPGGTRSWIDHVLVPSWLGGRVGGVRIGYDCISSDHFPLFCEVEYETVDEYVSALGEMNAEVLEASNGVGRIDWDKVGEGEKSVFIQRLAVNLSLINVPNCAAQCDNVEQCIDNYFDDIVNAYRCASLSLPTSKRVIKHNAQVVGWNEYVYDKHAAARHDYVQWREDGRPTVGTLYDDMNRSRRLFKTAFRRCKYTSSRIESDKLANNMLKKNSKQFWKSVQYKRSAGKTARVDEVDGVVGDREIADMWKNKYVSIYNKGGFLGDKAEIMSRLNEVYDGRNDLVVTNDAIITALNKLQTGRSVGSDGINAELLKMYCVDSINHWQLLFNMFVKFGYSPKKLLEVKLCPILKDKNGNVNCSDNYRCIAISSCVSKLMELVMLEYIQSMVILSDNQFGFRQGHSTGIAHALLKKVVSSFRSRGSYTFLCFLDMSKAFDYVNCWKLFSKLLDKGVARNVVTLLLFWYSNEIMYVQWNSVCSAVFGKGNGVRQGSPLSPFLFSLYIDDMLCNIHNSDVGCKLFGMRANVIGYADDIVLLAPSWAALQVLLNLAAYEADKIDMCFNLKKNKMYGS